MVALVLALFIKWWRQGWREMKAHWMKHALESLVPALGAVILIFAYNLFIGVPTRIRAESAAIKIPIPTLSAPSWTLSVPYFPSPLPATTQSAPVVAKVDTKKSPMAQSTSSTCVPVPSASGGVGASTSGAITPGVTASASVVVRRGSAESGTDSSDFTTTGKGTYELDMAMLKKWRPEVLEFKFSDNTFMAVTRDKGIQQTVKDFGRPLIVERFTDTGFVINDNGCAGIPYRVTWTRGSVITPLEQH
jgi:hypothetical protein